MTVDNILILNYHKIDDKKDIGITTRRPHDFQNDLFILQQNGFETTTFKDLTDSKNIPEKPVIITFDDAYESFYSNAFPILLKMNMSAVVYVPVNYIGINNDWDVQVGSKKYKHMNIDQLKAISQKGFELGSHSLTHRNLNFMNEQLLDQEIRVSKEKLEQITGERIVSFSYPFGKFNEKVIKIVAKHYKFAVRLTSGKNSFNGSSHMTLPRINIYRNDSHQMFQNKLVYRSRRLLLLKNKMIQQGSWATILLQQFKKFNQN